jgi:NADP-dependent 3-hydroxy acid dehydrogenase YdfG
MTSKMSVGVPQADGRIAEEPTMDVNDVAKSVIFMAGLPLDANVLTMTVMATKMPLIGRG